MLGREQILAAAEALPRQVVKVAALGGDVLLVGMTAGQREAFDRAVYRAHDAGEPPRVRARVIAACVCDGEARPLFGETDLEAIERLPARVAERLYVAAQRLSGFGAGADEDAEKN